MIAPSTRTRRARGNIVLIAGIIVLALGVSAVGLTRMLKQQLDVGADMKFSNYASTLAASTAEGVINEVVYNWNAGFVPAAVGIQVPGAVRPGVGNLRTFPSVLTPYQLPSGVPLNITSTIAYTVSVAGPAPPNTWTVTAVATVNSVGGGGSFQNAGYGLVQRTVVATVGLLTTGPVTEYAVLSYTETL